MKEQVEENADQKKTFTPCCFQAVIPKGKRKGKTPKGESKGAENDDYLATTWPPTEEFPDYLATPPKEKNEEKSNRGFELRTYAFLADHHFLIEVVVVIF